MGTAHSVTLSSGESAHGSFKLINTLAGNMKKFIDGTYHGREEHKQLYVEEFVYRFDGNRTRSAPERLCSEHTSSIIATCSMQHGYGLWIFMSKSMIVMVDRRLARSTRISFCLKLHRSWHRSSMSPATGMIHRPPMPFHCRQGRVRGRMEYSASLGDS